MASYRRAHGRSRDPRRYVPWSKKVFYLVQSKKKIPVDATWHDGIFLGITDESEVAVVGTPHGIVFARSIRRVPKEDSVEGMLFNSLPWDLQIGVERERDRQQSAVCCQSRCSSSTSSTADNKGATAKKSLHQASSGIGEVRVQGPVYRVPACKVGIEEADHSEKCRAEMVRHMTADDDLSQRVQVAQQRIVDTVPSEAHAGGTKFCAGTGTRESQICLTS